MERIRNLIVLKIAPQPEPYLVLFDYSRAELERYARQTTLSELQQVYWLIAEAERNIKFSPNPRFVLEMALAKMATVQALEPLEELNRQLAEIKATLAATAPGEREQQPSPPAPPKTVMESPEIHPPQDLSRIWEAILALVRQKRPSLAAVLRNAIPVELTQETFTLSFHQDTSVAKNLLADQKKMAVLQEALQESLGRTVRVVTTTHNGAVSTASMREQLERQSVSRPVSETTPQTEPQPAPASTAAKPHSPNKNNWKNRSHKPLQYKPRVQVTVQDIVKMFDGEIEE